MVIKVYVSGISGNKEVKKRQQRVALILDSKNIKYDLIDIAEPGAEEAKDFMQNNSTAPGATIGDSKPRHPLPPQIFNDEVYCGDYDMFDMANEIDEMEKFLKLEPSQVEDKPVLKNGEITNDVGDKASDSNENEVPIEQNEAEEDDQSKETAQDGKEKTENGEEDKEATPEKADE